MMSSLRVDPQEAKKRFVENGIRKGSWKGQYYLKSVRILAGKLSPLLQAVVFVDSSEEGELRRKSHQKGENFIRISFSRRRPLYYSI